MTNRTIVDITRLATWPGRVTGIPRVISEYIRRAGDDENAVFVVWDHPMQRFEEVDAARTAVLHGQGVQYILQSGSGARRARAFRFAGIGRISGFLRRRGVRTKSTQLMNRARRLERLRYSERVVVEAGAGDTFVSFMGEWDDQGYIDAILAADARGSAVVQVSYDLLPIVTPQVSGHSTKPMISYLTQVLPVADLVLAISEHTKSDLIEWADRMQVRHGRVEVFRLGDDFGVDRSDSPNRGNVPARVGDGGFVLCVGTVEARKNHTLLYFVYRLAASRGLDLPPLVIVGREGWRGSDILHILREDPVLAGKVFVLEGTDDTGLAWLYRNCRLTIYPSIYEGWGLPIAESLAWGKPTLASKTSSMTEIAGDLIDYFDPFSAEECLAAIYKLTDDAALAEAAERASRYEPTLWSETVTQLTDLIGSVRAS
ncbi:glycosyltransferase family 1 protein [Salinibacterium sp. G-O1]|uniref:glycosyltransferase family 4 protein n=1 Tax=Salinibacterium sp. G-O1 TaxID=3046208 RepID=UPI0024B976AB|nr:glycosyltransferase family 1 protein [Salinibacterium sp. G-O1]MDJ0336526.1 glycosyltransferase family 1 protein [Salinibacterium sp. G-O1]